MKKIWSIGVSNFDIVAQPITHFPVYGGSVNADTVDMLPGGMALNTAIALAKIGKAPVGLISIIGDDLGGRFLKESMLKYNIDISQMSYSHTANSGTALCFIHPDGERSMVLCMAVNDQFTDENIRSDAFNDGDILHFGGSIISKGTRGENLARILKRLKEKNVTISIDTVWDITGQGSSQLTPSLPYCDIFETNLEEAKLYSGKDNLEDALEFFASFGPRIIIVKLGSKGVRIKSDEINGVVPTFKVDAVDETGAGDAFDAGLLTGLYHGWPLEQAAIFGSAVGAKCVTAFGATTGVGSYEETLDFIRSQSRLGDWNWNILP
jgi:sugar/nucleoside kinase (ribokinase family)